MVQTNYMETAVVKDLLQQWTQICHTRKTFITDWSRALETESPDTWKVERENEIASALQETNTEMETFIGTSKTPNFRGVLADAPL